MMVLIEKYLLAEVKFMVERNLAGFPLLPQEHFATLFGRTE
jgi:hypothetical protein